MNAFQFGPPDALRLGVYHPPRVSVARDVAVLLCAPVAVEYQRTHYALRLLAMQLASAGLHVLRFDYLGTGDSAGEVGEGQYATCTGDVALAADELMALSGAKSLIVAGLRLGAVFAVEALVAGLLRARSVVLWDPVVSGREYLDSQLAMERLSRERASAPKMASDEILGMRYPADLRQALLDVDLCRQVERAPVDAAGLVVSEERGDFSELAARMKGRWPAAPFVVGPDSGDWRRLEATYDARMTGPIIRLVGDVIEALA